MSDALHRNRVLNNRDLMHLVTTFLTGDDSDDDSGRLKSQALPIVLSIRSVFDYFREGNSCFISHRRDFISSVQMIEWSIQLGSGYTRDSDTLCTQLAADGNVRLLEWARSQEYSWSWETSQAAAKYKNSDVLEWLIEQTPPCPLNTYTSQLIAENGWANMIQRISNSSNLPPSWSRTICAGACRGGHLDILQWASSRNPPYPLTTACCINAAEAGHLYIIQWLLSQNPPCPWDWRVTACIAGRGHMDVLQYVRSLRPPCPWNENTCSAAARAGRLDIIQFAREHTPPCDWSELTLASAASMGHLHVVVWCREQSPPCKWDSTVTAAAAEGAHLHVLQWLREQNPPCPWGVSTCASAARRGHLQVLQYARSMEPPCPWDW
eukprot:CAMPEP_0185041968 /NCGR_PEP_ID=MMETSP1103-20130426/41902_1 /TAXON_ID=36769 /ORGANISM="Paraphysomonas bandaiensis, Strain Caron Lab Isolate" /LENGTH=379 /DNA_ID=CAMNT_0027581919 /DNA_START=33 /DNA_END=1169 /DNA_ORIENTATION=+